MLNLGSLPMSPLVSFPFVKQVSHVNHAVLDSIDRSVITDSKTKKISSC
jgi:hypothetical protein